MLRPVLPPLLAAFALAACDGLVEVDHPFYLTRVSEEIPEALVRCPDGPRGGCAIDNLPGDGAFKAGADKGWIVFAREPRGSDPRMKLPTQYYYFERVPEETRGWGDNPEKVVGPLTEAEFTAAKARLGLPHFTAELR
jgi:hypothetical protein